MKNILKKLLFYIALISVISGCVASSPNGSGYTVSLPISVIGDTLSSNFPIDKKMQYGTLNISNASILSKANSGDKLSIGTNFKFSNFLLPNGIAGEVKLTSAVRYDAKTKNLYLDKPMLDELSLNNKALSSFLTKDMKKAISILIAQIVTQYPIYNLKDAGVVSGFVKDIDIKQGKLLVTFGL
jgi:hypothetical protein